MLCVSWCIVALCRLLRLVIDQKECRMWNCVSFFLLNYFVKTSEHVFLQCIELKLFVDLVWCRVLPTISLFVKYMIRFFFSDGYLDWSLYSL